RSMRCLSSLERSKPTRAERFASVSPGSRRYTGETNFGPLVFSPPRLESTKTSSKDRLRFRRKSTRANYSWISGFSSQVPRAEAGGELLARLELAGKTPPKEAAVRSECGGHTFQKGGFTELISSTNPFTMS